MVMPKITLFRKSGTRTTSREFLIDEWQRVAFAVTPKQRQQLKSNAHKIAKRWGLKVSTHKTKTGFFVWYYREATDAK